ncbi:MAG: malonic semialdehyde reductase [Acidimicrobiales bacterium]
MTTDLYALEAPAQNLLFREAHTAKTFTNEPVTDQQVAAIYDLIKWGPTMTNSQPLRIVLARSDDARARVVSHMLPSNADKTASAPLIAVLAADMKFNRHIERIFPDMPHMAKMYENDGFREPIADSQAWMQAGYFVMGVRAIGLDACPMLGLDRPGLDADLFADSDLRCITVVLIGKPGPDAYGQRLPRLNYDEVVSVL